MIDARQEMLASEKVGKVLWKMSYPAAIGAAVMALYNVVDTIFIGQIVGPLGIAGLAIVFPLQIIGMGMGMMIGMGSSSLISRTLGAGDTEKSERALGNAVFFTLVIGLLITVVGLSNSGFWLRLAGASDTILPYAKTYFDIILIGMIFRIGGMGLSQLIRAEGNARVAMLCMSLGFALNIVLDAVFVLWLGMGIKGAAIATVIAELFSTVLVIWYYLSGKSTLKIRVKNLNPDWKIAREVFAIGFGAFVMTTGGSLIQITVNKMLNSYGGDLAIASFGMIQRAMTLFFIPIMSIGQGLQPLLGFAYGANRPERALASIKLAMTVGTGFAILSFAVVQLFAEPIMGMFTQDAALVEASARAGRILFATAFLIGFQMVGQVVFQALGKPVQTFLASTSRQILFLLPMIFILPKFWGLDGLYCSVPVSDVLSVILTVGMLIFVIKELKSGKIRPQATFPGRPDMIKAGGSSDDVGMKDRSGSEEYM
jgi:putative MATE family efflux protein